MSSPAIGIKREPTEAEGWVNRSQLPVELSKEPLEPINHFPKPGTTMKQLKKEGQERAKRIRDTWSRYAFATGCPEGQVYDPTTNTCEDV